MEWPTLIRLSVDFSQEISRSYAFFPSSACLRFTRSDSGVRLKALFFARSKVLSGIGSSWGKIMDSKSQGLNGQTSCLSQSSSEKALQLQSVWWAYIGRWEDSYFSFDASSIPDFEVAYAFQPRQWTLRMLEHQPKTSSQWAASLESSKRILFASHLGSCTRMRSLWFIPR